MYVSMYACMYISLVSIHGYYKLHREIEWPLTNTVTHKCLQNANLWFLLGSYIIYVSNTICLADLEASTSEDEFEDNEMKVEHWRAERFLCENYLDSIRVTYIISTSIKICKRPQFPLNNRKSYI